MSEKKSDSDQRFPGVHPIPEPDNPDDNATDMIDEVVGAILENKDEKEILNEKSTSKDKSIRDE
ncbi:hypothetical protein [Paenibacillus faecalis]|uniref:hypothetical protein n=1 Tax=Paenibacillus faecalis TaxID=2079532 RepID=UPI000D10FA9E|nr:hypothetical protein [Paenibacillus faecalis]